MATTPTASPTPAEAIAQVPGWYHCIEVAPGVRTPGAFDLEPVVERLPWPEVRGKRCLDVGTYDGFLAFELEGRGAREVVATDIHTPEDWDWELHLRAQGPDHLRRLAGPAVGAGLRVARELRGSAVRPESISVYDLSPERVGKFDLVVCGSLLLHLRDPLRALEAIRSVCADEFLCTNQVELGLSLLHPRRPLFRLDGTSGMTQWWLPNRAANRQLLRAAGFRIVRESGLYTIPYGPAHPPRRWTRGSAGARLAQRLLVGGEGVPHQALLCTVG